MPAILTQFRFLRPAFSLRFVTLSLMLLSALLILTVLFLPWWTNRFSYVIQNYLIWYPWDLPRHYTGVIRHYNTNFTLSLEKSLVNGERDGMELDFDDHGKVINSGEFRQGKPWNGFCHFREGKAWIAEYKDGRIYNGAMTDDSRVSHYYVDGADVDKATYCKHYGMPETANCAWGLGFWKIGLPDSWWNR